MDQLPFLISIPHGGDQVPEEVKSMIALTPEDIFYDGDSLTRRLYGFGDKVTALIDTPIARAVVDLNRSPDDRPPNNPDGIVKTVALTGAPVYKNGWFPDQKTIDLLLNNYYYPYQQKLDHLANHPEVLIAFDCHSMLPYAPMVYQHLEKKRPLICLSNRGDRLGRPFDKQSVVTCDPDLILQLANCFREAFEIPAREVQINNPFNGGHITRSHYKGGIPWVQIEINKKLYLPEAILKEQSTTYIESKLSSTIEMIWKAFQLFSPQLLSV